MAEFQKILDHKTLALNFPLAALAQLDLARAYAATDDTDASTQEGEPEPTARPRTVLDADLSRR